MSSNHDVARERQPLPQQAPEVPRRPRSTVQTSNHSGIIVNSNNHSTQQPHPPQPAVREIHKNAWLKRITPSEKKGTPFVKKYEKLWVVFCVHDDVEAFLEFYTEPKMGATHRPNGYISLNSCLHVSPSIIGQENNEYQFAVTLSTQVIRLVAANWDQMMEWVESLQGKLREMNILSPKDNLYSKLPESRNLNYPPGYISTRDPNSPLPPTPNGYSSPVLGTESATYLPVSSTSNPDPEGNRGSSFSNISNRQVSNANGNSSGTAGPISMLNEQYVSAGTTSIYVQPSSRDGSGSDSGNGSGGSVMSINEPRITIFPISVLSCSSSSNHNTGPYELGHESDLERPNTPPPSVSVVTGNHNSTVVQVGSDENHCFNDNFSQQVENSTNTSFLQPDAIAPPQSHLRTVQQSTSSYTEANPPIITHTAKHHSDILERQHSAPSRPNSSSSENVYEHLFLPESESSNSNSNPGQRGSSFTNMRPSDGLSCPPSEAPPALPRRDLHKKRINTQRSSSLNRLEEQNRSRNSSSSRRNQNLVNQRDVSDTNNSNRQRSNHKDVVRRPQINNGSSISTAGHPHSQGLQGDPMEALVGVRSGEYRIRREEAQPHENEPDIAAGLPRNPLPVGGNLMSHIPLKEQQVMRLRAEINHPGGVRIVLRKKDCVNSIGLVDYLGAVWVAGWKQQQHPVLYYAFHVGDQILKVAGVTVQSSVEASRAIKMVSNLQVEFIIRRVPHGSVFVLKRSREGEPLGLVLQNNNTPEIGEVLKDGLSASQGLPLTSRGIDGQSTCTWFLTEVNNRPLSLVARENEVRDRLNAVGKEISILVQPSDLVKQLKKQLKSIKGFKDYLVV